MSAATRSRPSGWPPTSGRLAALLERAGGTAAAELVEAALAGLAAFTGGVGCSGDDLTVMAVRRS